MANSGLNVKDLLPLPEVVSPDTHERAHALDEQASMSHALAVTDHDEKGHAQLDHDAEVKDLGWQASNDKIANPLIGGMLNEELWILIRRFNKQLYHVKEYPYPVPGNLDLNIADDEEFSPDKLRANLERLYMTVGVGMLAFVKHIMRLRSWRESRRTTAFCAGYFVAWLLDLLVPTLTAMIVVLLVYPPSREFLFPRAPIALVSAKTGGIQKPKAGVLGSTDSATGAPENHKGEAVEAEAGNFVNSLAAVALASASGKHPQNDPPMTDDQSSAPDHSIPDPTAMAVGASDARNKAGGKHASSKHDKTKVPMQTAMWNNMRPIMHGLADVADTWERFGNALEPTAPFPRDVYRLRLAAVIVPVLAASFFISSYMVVKGTTFGIGFGFFGDPVISRGLAWLNSHFPKWQKILELRNTLLKGVPTNAQLTITLLRVGESNKAPLPPPPHAAHPPPEHPAEISEEHLRATGAEPPLNASEAELQEAMANDPSVPHESAGGDVAASQQKTQHKKGSRVLGALKATLKGTVNTALGADRLKAQVGNEHSKQRIGAIPRESEKEWSGPIDFQCRYHGKKGHAYISTTATIPCVSFSIDKSIADVGSTGRDDELHPVFSIAVADIKELKKVGGFGWKTKLVVGWALDREVADAIEIIDKQGNKTVLTAMVLRDELFNRLVAMGGQKWEAY